ncbi:MAG: sce7726 family protein [Ignavibacteriaceae bacterium]
MQIIDSKYNPYLSNLFSTTVLKEFATYNRSNLFDEVLLKSRFIETIKNNYKLADIYDALFEYLLENYRSEYVYKNAIALKILLGRHSLNTSSLLTELRVKSSKADIVILNGTSNVYEIKTEYDTLDRLDEQINSYLGMFDKIYVVTHSSQLMKIKKVLDKRIGVLELSDSYSLKIIRKPLSNKTKVIPSMIFDTFRKSEYIKAIKMTNHIVPNVPNTQLFGECKKIFSKLKPYIAHDIMIKVLAERVSKKDLIETKNVIPKSLMHSWLVSSLNLNQREKIINLLNTKFQKIHQSK